MHEGTDPTLDASRTLDADPMAPVDTELAPVPEHGARIGRYVVLGRLGAGAMGVVLSAYDPELDRKVAIKLLKPAPGRSGESARSRLTREAQALARLDHPNVVAVHDVGVHEGQVFVAMEFVEGRTIAAWLAERRRSWGEVLPVFEAAGRGLSAAHAEGLVHRDFKPENVMLGEDGRVRVMDFGLARAGEGEASLRDAEISESSSALDLQLTRTGAMLGTPAYMSPEQWSGSSATARSDQFAFCVALHEALHGVRPFAGSDVASLVFAVTQGKLVDPPPGESVPGWLRRVVLRGLAADPDQRYPDMEALLAELRGADARRRRNRMLAGGAVLALGGLSVLGGQRWDEAQRIEACRAQGDRIDEVWNDSVRSSVREGLLATKAPFAAAASDAALASLDAQADAIRRATTEVCLSTRVRGEWSEALLARAEGCLDERRWMLESMGRALSEATPGSAARAVFATSRLDSVDPCMDELRLGRDAQPHWDEASDASWRALVSSSTQEALGDYEGGLAAAREALAEAERLERPRLQAAARFRIGSMLERTGDREGAEAAMEQAYFEAGAAGSMELSAEVAIGLAHTVGVGLARPDDGLRWGRHADLVLQQLDEPADGLRRMVLAGARGSIHKQRGEFALAQRHHEEAVGIAERVLGPDHPSTALHLNNLANAVQEAGDNARAESLQQRVLTIFEASLGSEHPYVAATLNNMANGMLATEDYERARVLLERALELRKTTLGLDHPHTATSFNNLGNANTGLGEYDTAREQYGRALEILERTLGPEHPRVGSVRHNLAALHERAGDRSRAREQFQRALDIKQAALGPEHASVAGTLARLANLQREAGELDEALARYQRALAIQEAALDPEHLDMALTLDGLARVLLERGSPVEARHKAEQALRIRVAGGAGPEALASSRFTLARALWDAPVDGGRDRSRARKLAEQARDAHRAAGTRPESLAKVEAWLAERPASGLDPE